MRSRAAASSIASGIPSRRRHSVRDRGALSEVDAQSPERCWRARSANSRTASQASRPRDRRRPAGRTARGRRYRCSPSIPSGSRLVARMLIRGQPRTNWSATLAASSITCSQLSRITSNCRSPHAPISDSAAIVPAAAGTPSTLASLAATSVGVGQRGEIDKPDPVARPVQHARCELQREPRLAHAPAASQRDHASARQQLPKLAQLALTTDEAGDLSGQVVRRVPVLARRLTARRRSPQRPTAPASGPATLHGEGSPARARRSGGLGSIASCSTSTRLAF